MLARKTQAKNIIFSLITAASFCYLNSTGLDNVFVFFTVSLSSYIFYCYAGSQTDIYIRIVSILLSFLVLLGKYLVYVYESAGLALALKVIITPIGFYILTSRLLAVLFCYFDKFSTKKGTEVVERRITILAFIIIFICWIPCWLANYPGYYAPDTINQINQIFGIYRYSNANPLIHTLLIKLFYLLFSHFLDNNNAIFGAIGIVQMLVNSLIYSLVVRFVYKKTGSKLFSFLAIAFYALMSFNALYNMSISKDAMYASTLALLVILISAYKNNQSTLRDVLLTIVFALYGLMRANGFYSLLIVAVLAIALGLYRNRRKLTIIIICGFMLCTIIKYPVYSTYLNSANKSFETSDTSNSTSTSYFKGSFLYVMVFQQVANVVYHERELNEKETWLIEEYAPLETIKETYNPILVDPLFEMLVTTTQSTRQDINNIEYVKLWIELFLKYPADYIEAYINMTRYYFYPNRYVKVCYDQIYNNEEGITKEEIVSTKFESFLNNIYEGEKDIPLVGSLFSPGVTTFIMLIAMAYSLHKKNKVSLVCLLLYFTNFLILMACVPVNDEFRYIYPIVVSLPFICTQFFVNEVNDEL